MRFVCLFALLASAVALAQTNAVPFVNQPLVPTTTAPGGPQFTLTVNGTGFVSNSVVNWNATHLATTFVTNSQLTAIVPAANIATAGTATITVTNPAPGGGVSNVQYFSITNEVSSLVFSDLYSLPPGFSVPSGQNLFVAAADFNGDGQLDLADVSFYFGQNEETDTLLTILLGNGNGTFRTGGQYDFGNGDAFSIAVADFNGDGKPDVAVTNASTDTVWVFLGNGDGTLQNPKKFTTGIGPIQVMAGDFNRDGKLDLAVSCNNNGPGALSILLGNGDGTFQPHIDYGSEVSEPTAATMGDFNNDGTLDIAFFANHNDELYLLLGNGDGSFRVTGGPAEFSSNVQWMFPVDLNNDGKLDLLVTDQSNNDAVILLGNGDGTFRSPERYTVGNTIPTEIVPGDFNGDGKLDLASANSDSYSPSTIGILLGNGDGTFQSPVQIPANPRGTGPLYTYFLVAGDFNGDGQNDLVALDVFYDLVLLQGIWPGAVSVPQYLSFSQNVGSSSPTQSVTLLSTGQAVYDISSISITGANASDFSQTNSCGATLAPNDSCVLKVIFTPGAVGTRNAAINITGNYPTSVPLSGYGVGSLASPAPSTVNFPGQYVGTSGLPQTVTVTNTGNAALTITGLTTSISDFGTLSNCSNAVQPGMNCTIGVFFDPTASGNRAGTLSITSNAVGSPQVVQLMGAGQDFSLAAHSPNQTVSPGQTATYAVDVTPNGGFDQTVQLSCSGMPADSTCSVAPAAVTLDGSGPQQVTVSVATSGSSGGLTSWNSRPPSTAVYALCFGGLCFLGMLAATARSRRRILGSALAAVLCLGALSAGCGGSAVSAGTYNLTVTGMFTSKSTTITRTTKLTLTVQ